jgi:DNA-binding PucR family transcriptional regulator
MLTGAVSAVRSHLDGQARAVLGTLVGDLTGAPDSRRAADLALGVPSTEPVLGFDDVRARLIAGSIDNHLQTQLISHPELLDPRVAALVADQPMHARTLLAYLDAGCDVVRVAGLLGVHPTTVRHRLRRAQHRLRVELVEPDERLATHLLLRCSLHARPKER